VEYEGTLVTSLSGEVVFPNEPGILVEYRAIGYDRQNVRSDEGLAPVGRYVLIGAPIGSGATDIVRTDDIMGGVYRLVLRGGITTWDLI